jgi:hypothetical protein
VRTVREIPVRQRPTFVAFSACAQRRNTKNLSPLFLLFCFPDSSCIGTLVINGPSSNVFDTNDISLMTGSISADFPNFETEADSSLSSKGTLGVERWTLRVAR